jgi:hypothetical protein
MDVWCLVMIMSLMIVTTVPEIRFEGGQHIKRPGHIFLNLDRISLVRKILYIQLNII